MKKYAKIIYPGKGICEVGIGNPDAVYRRIVDPETGAEETLYVRDYYKLLGMELMEVEQGANGGWYLPGYAPPPPKTKTVRTFSKFSIWVATRDKPIAEGSDVMVWDAFESFLHECQLWAGWNQLIDLVEDNPFFEQFYPIACEKLGKELVDQVLEASVVSTQEIIVG